MNGLIPVKLQIQSCATQAEMNENLDATFARGYEPLTDYLDRELGRSVHLCGAGPSLRETYGAIPADADILAINSAIGFLIDNGRVPRWAMIWDASELCEKFAVPHPDITYLIAARCHPKVFERLAGCKMVVWHAGGDHNVREYLLEKGINEPLVNGGTAGVTRGLYLAYALGYRDFHVHGADSSYSAIGDTHVRGSLVPEKNMSIFVCGRWFRTTPEWCAQVEEIKIIFPLFRMAPMQAQITVYGDGMFQHVVRYMQQDEPKAIENARAAFESMKNAQTTTQPLEELSA